MKKVFALLTLFAALVSCGNKDNPAEEVEKIPTVAPAKEAQKAYKLTFTTPSQNVSVNVQTGTAQEVYAVKYLDFMPDGSYCGYTEGEPLKGTALRHYFSGSYTTDSDGAYNLAGAIEGKLKIVNDNSFQFTPKGGTTPTVLTGSGAPNTPSTDLQNALCTKWKINQIEATIEQPSVKHTWTGTEASDVEAICKYINNKGGTIDLNKVKGYVVKNISLSPTSVTVNFTSSAIEPIMGSWSFSNITDRKFHYDMSQTVSGEFISGTADGVIDFKKVSGDTYVYDASGNNILVTVTVQSNKLTGKVLFALVKDNS